MTIAASSQHGATVVRIRQLGVLPVVELDSAAQAVPLLDSLIAGGLPAAEITLRTSAGLEALRLLRRERPGALVGAGTVRSLDDAERVLEAGAQFVVSPSTYPELIELCVQAGVPPIPGTCSPTEVDTALRSGARAVKFFPAEPMGGIRFLKALAGPYPEARFIPTGGVTADNLASYLELPGVLACGGSWLVAPRLVRHGAFDEVQARTRDAVKIIEAVRSRV